MEKILAWLRRRTPDVDLFWDLYYEIPRLLVSDGVHDLTIKEISRRVLFARWQVKPVVEQLLKDGMLEQRRNHILQTSVYRLTIAGLELTQPTPHELAKAKVTNPQEPEPTEIGTPSEEPAPGPDLKFLQAPTTLAFAWADRGTYDGEKEVVAWGFHHHQIGDCPILVTDAQARQVIGWFRDNAEVLKALQPDSPDEFGRRLITVQVGQPAQELQKQLRERRDEVKPPSAQKEPKA